LAGSPVLEAVASGTGAKGSHQATRLSSERPRISPDYSGKVPLSRGKINIPGSQGLKNHVAAGGLKEGATNIFFR
jgi:hypothetical protein